MGVTTLYYFIGFLFFIACIIGLKKWFILPQQKNDIAEEKARREIAEKLRLAAEAHFGQEEQARLKAEESANLAAQERKELAVEKPRAVLELSTGIVGGPLDEVERQARLLAENQSAHELDLQAKKAADDIVEKLEEIANEKISDAANELELAAHKEQEQARLSGIEQERERSRRDFSSANICASRSSIASVSLFACSSASRRAFSSASFFCFSS